MTEQRRLVFERLSIFARHGPGESPAPMNEEMHRAQVPGGWLVLIKTVMPTLIFYPDPQHRWDGGSIEES